MKSVEEVIAEALLARKPSLANNRAAWSLALDATKALSQAGYRIVPVEWAAAEEQERREAEDAHLREIEQTYGPNTGTCF